MSSTAITDSTTPMMQSNITLFWFWLYCSLDFFPLSQCLPADELPHYRGRRHGCNLGRLERGDVAQEGQHPLRFGICRRVRGYPPEQRLGVILEHRQLEYGRGVEDNQQGLCSAAFAALYYIKNGITPSHTVKLLFVADEENGSNYGCTWLVKNTDLFRKDDLVIIPDGGDSKGETIEIAEKNLLWLQVHVMGKQTHGSRPDSGANACLAACDLSLRLNGLEKIFNKTDDLFEPNYSTFQPTKRAKNVDSINIIPGEDTFCMDCRILPCYKLSEVLKEVERCCRLVEAEHGVKIEYTVPQQSESPATPVTAPVAQKLAAALKTVHNIDAKFIGIGGGTVGAELRREGIDAVVWSTLDDQAHQPNEYCIIDNLIKDAMTIIELFKQNKKMN